MTNEYSYEAFDVRVDDGLARVGLNQPAAGNPFNSQACREFAGLGDDLAARGDVRAVLLHATGRFFSVGGDLEMFTSDLDRRADTVRRETRHLHIGMARLLRLDAPIVACVHASAMGGAVAVVSNCDLVIAARSARFGAAYSHIGFTCDLGATFGLASRMGLSRARRFLLLGETLDADGALQAGLVDELCDDASVYAVAEQRAVTLSRGPTRAYGAIRRLMARSLSTPFEAQLEEEAQALSTVAASEDAREGLSAFREKRSARFSGR
jgi:2-(1,2-epoxy-1,2-dihydrophenyl)acetyl-CoA isomerase